MLTNQIKNKTRNIQDISNYIEYNRNYKYP